MRIAISGARGLIGGALTARLRELNHDVSPILRVGAPVSATTECRFFDPAGGPACLTALEGTDAVIHLAGHPIGKRRLDAAERSAIYASRVYGTRSLVSGLGELANPPRILLAASASGYYGSRGDELLDETSPSGSSRGCCKLMAIASRTRRSPRRSPPSTSAPAPRRPPSRARRPLARQAPARPPSGPPRVGSARAWRYRDARARQA
jgi:nucleoside-diphosphate-sugar epimerase